MPSAALTCALLSSKYSALLDLLREETAAAGVVRVGPADADEPYPARVLGPDELPGPPPARYVIECRLSDGHLLHVSDHRGFGLRKLARPAAAPEDWIIELWSDRDDYASVLVATAACSERSVDGLLDAVRDVLRMQGMRGASSAQGRGAAGSDGGVLLADGDGQLVLDHDGQIVNGEGAPSLWKLGTPLVQ